MIGGAGLGRGYLNRPDLTALAYIPNPFGSGARLYRTGDWARRRPDGRLVFLGRRDNQVKLRGFRVELGEIERALAQDPDIRRAVVILLEEEAEQGAVKRLVAYVEPEPGSYSDEEGSSSAELNQERGAWFSGEGASRLRDFLANRLPEYMLPEAFVFLNAIPLTPNGKTDRSALPLPEEVAPRAAAQTRSAMTPTEEILADLWRSLLDPERIAIHDNFFNLGGHSLLATQMLLKVRKIFQVDISMARFFSAPTISELALSIDQARLSEISSDVPPLCRVENRDVIPLSYAQQRVWLVYQSTEDPAAFHLVYPIRITGDLHLPALEQTIGEIMKRHEVLRTTFAIQDNQPVQIITPFSDWRLTEIDLSKLAQPTPVIDEMTRTFARQPFDLNKGPLIRSAILTHAPKTHTLYFSMHHIVSDGWSIGILVDELIALYEAFSKGRPSPLPELPIQYADFAIWQRNWFQGKVFERELAYWTQQLKDLSMVQKLPTILDRPQIISAKAGNKSFLFPEDFQPLLQELCRREGVTMFMLLLAAFQVLLFSHTSEPDIVVGADVANRNQDGLEKLIGFFINQLVLRTDFSDNPSFQTILARVRRTTIDAYTHQNMPFDKLVESLLEKRISAVHPFFQVKLVFQNMPTSELNVSGLNFAPIQTGIETAKVDLQCNMWEEDGRIGGVFKFKTDLFQPVTIARLVRHFETILLASTEHVEATLSDFQDRLARADTQHKREQLAKRKLKGMNRFQKPKSKNPPSSQQA